MNKLQPWLSTEFFRIIARQINPRWLGALFCLNFIWVNWFLEKLMNEIPEPALIRFYLNPAVSLCAQLITWINPDAKVVVFHNSLLSENVNLKIVKTCSGLSIFSLLAAAIAVFSAPFKQKLWGIGLGLLLVISFNELRIVLLYFTMAYQPDLFMLVHLYLAPALIIIVCCLYYTWWSFRVLKKS